MNADPSRPGASPFNATHRLAGRIGRHSLVYGVGIGLVILVSLVNLAIFTRFLPPGEFGTLALLLVLAGGLSIIYNLATLQGTLGLVFGKGSEDGLDDEFDAPDEVGDGSDKREALGTGLLLTLLVAALGTLVVLAAEAQIATAILHSPAAVEGVRLAAGAGAGGAVFRLLLAIPRLERRPRVYVALNVTRPLLAIAVGVPFVVRGDGVMGVLTGYVIATAAIILLSLLMMHKAYRLRFRPRLVLPILKLGLVFVPVALSLYVISHAGVLILAGDVSSTDIGLYTVAALFGNLIVLFATIFFMAWLPMKRTSLFVAVHKERGHGWVYSTVTTYFVLCVATLLVIVTAASGLLVKIAGSSYGGAEELIPVLGVAAVAHSMFLLAYRISAFPRKRLALGAVTTFAAAIFLVGSVFLVRPLGVYGVPAAATLAFSSAALTMLVLNQRGTRSIPFEYGRLGRVVAASGMCVGTHVALVGGAGSLRPLLDFGTVLAFFSLVLRSRALSRAELTAFSRIVRENTGVGGRNRVKLAASLAALPPHQVRVLKSAIDSASGRSLCGASPAGMVAALRLVAVAGGPTEHDDGIGRYLMSDLSRAERDALARGLWHRGVAPEDLDRLEEALDGLERLPGHDWPPDNGGPAARRH